MYGRQEPTERACPDYTATQGPLASRMLERAGFPMMPWQSMLLDDWLSRKQDGETGSESWLCPTCGASVPRQNGKTRLVAGLMAFVAASSGAWCVYTSHLQKTSTETFEEVQSIFESAALAKRVKVIKTAIGREEVQLTNGGRIKFLARTRNGGRGQHADLWVCDEAQELTDEQQGSFMPMLAASRNPQTVYIGTPPDENAPGSVFKRIRADALGGNAHRTAWAEWGVPTIGDVNDRERWALTNPSLGYLIREGTIEAEASQMAPDRFARERLGWWSKAPTEESVIQADDWQACRTDSPPWEGVTCFAVKFSPSGSDGCIAACIRPYEGAPHVEVAWESSLRHGVRPFAEWLMDASATAAQIVVDGQGDAQALVDMLDGMGIERGVVIKAATRDAIAANAGMLSAVKAREVTHYGQASLDASATKTRKRNIGRDGGWGFQATDQADSIQIEAAALALWAALRTRRDPSAVQTIG